MAAEPNANVVADLNKAFINANSGDDKNETALLMMSPSMNWAEFLTPAPLSIALLGQLMLVAGEKDFSLENQRPEKGFQFIHHPKSFRACLVQVSNSGWKAFNEAHKNMDAIRLYSAEVPDQVNKVKNVVRTLVKGSEKDVEDFLPIELGKIDRNATECLRLAQAVEAKFEHVMDLTGELLEVFSASRGYYKTKTGRKSSLQEIGISKRTTRKASKSEKAVDGTKSANSFSSSVAKSAVKNAGFTIAEARGFLERQENFYDQTCKELKESNEELSKALERFAEYSPEKIANFDKIRKTLSQGLVALDSVRRLWQKLVEVSQYITSFVEYAKVGQKRVLANGHANTDFMPDLIYEQVSQANTTSYVVWSVANRYVEISRDHLMSQIASLGHLVALDPEKERGAIEAKRKELMEGSQEAQEAIMKNVSEAKDHFHEEVAKRIKQMETELLKALPSEDPAKIREINDSVKNAIKEADQELGADKF